MSLAATLLATATLGLAALLLQGCGSLDEVLAEGEPRTSRSDVSDKEEGVLMPPYVAPPGTAAAKVRAGRGVINITSGNSSDMGNASLARPRNSSAFRLRGAAPGHPLQRQQQRQQQQLAAVSEAALEGFRLLKELRAAGFTCPGGRHYPPNDGELEFDCRLWRAALGHSQDMGERDYFAHISPEGTDPFDRSAPHGLPTFNENLAAGKAGPAVALEMWKKSDGHCRNMMDAGHNRMAVAYAFVSPSTYKHYWTQLFTNDVRVVHRSCYTSEPDPADGGDDSEVDGEGEDEVGGACEDLDSGCKPWVRLGYCEAGHTYESFMRGNCRLSCGICGGDGARAGHEGGDAGGACDESDANCPHWASLGYCEETSEYALWMQDTCKVSCGVCAGSDGGDTSGTDDSGDACHDADSTHCPHWGSIGYCEAGSVYAAYMRDNCRLSCGLCS